MFIVKYKCQWKNKLLMPKYLDALANVYTAMQVYRKFRLKKKKFNDFLLKYLLPESLKIFILWKPFKQTIK